MVYEFPELQGIMGEKYALANGENPEVARLIPITIAKMKEVRKGIIQLSQKFTQTPPLLENGETIEGVATLPQNRHHNNSIKVKKNGSEIALSIESDEIYQILYTIYNGNKYLFERNFQVKISVKQIICALSK